MQPLVTISIPLYNCEESLENSLESVRRQTYRNLEVTLINDCTPDNSVRIAEDFIKKYNLKNWKIYHLEKNSGLSVVRNKGIDTAEGKYIFFLDSDDSISDDCIEKMLQVSENDEAQLTVSQTECFDLKTGKRSFCLGLIENIEPIIGRDGVLSGFAENRITSTATNKLVRVDFLKENQIYFVPGLYAQDELWTFHFCLKADRVGFCKAVTYQYFLHDKSVIHNRGKRHFDNWFTIGKYMDEAYRAEKDKNRKRIILNYLTRYKDMTLIMNWRAQKNEELWKESYRNYKTLSSLGLFDYFSSAYSKQTKKADFLNRLPAGFGMKIFKMRWRN